MNRIARGSEQVSHALAGHSHVMRAYAVVEEWQRMQQQAAALTREDVGKLSQDGLRFTAQLSCEHYDDISLRFANGSTDRVEFGDFNSHLPRSQFVVGAINQRQHGGVFRSRSNVNELCCLLAQTNRPRVDENEFRAAVAHRLANLLAGQRLQLFRLAANQDDRLRVTNVLMRCQRGAKILEEWF